MSILDEWLTGAQQIGAAALAGLGAVLLAWRNISKTRKATIADEHDIKVERRSWTWQQERDTMFKDVMREAAELRLELRDTERRAVRAEARLEMCEAGIRRDLAEQVKQFGACEERVRSLSERIHVLTLANGNLFGTLWKVDPAAAKELLEFHIRRPPIEKGEEPP